VHFSNNIPPPEEKGLDIGLTPEYAAAICCGFKLWKTEIFQIFAAMPLLFLPSG